MVQRFILLNLYVCTMITIHYTASHFQAIRIFIKARVTELEEEANSLQGWKADQKKGKVEGIKNAMKTYVIIILYCYGVLHQYSIRLRVC